MAMVVGWLVWFGLAGSCDHGPVISNSQGAIIWPINVMSS